MVKEEILKWVKDAMAKGHELEKLLAHLKSQGYPDIEIVQIRQHIISGKQASSEAAGKGVMGNTLGWILGVFTDPEKTMKQVAEHSRVAHVSFMGGIAIAVLFLTYILNHLLLEGTTTLASQVLNKFTQIVAPQGMFINLWSVGEFTLVGVLVNLAVTVLQYFLPLFGIAFAAHLLLHGLYHKSSLGKAYKIIGIPYGACAIAISFLNLVIVPILLVAEMTGSASFATKMVSAGLVGALILLIFFIVVISMYSYIAYAVAMKEKYQTHMAATLFISIVSTAAVVLSLLPLMAIFVVSVLPAV